MLKSKSKSKEQQAVQLEGELLRLNELVRARRAQLARLDACPNKDCECRTVWKESVDRTLAGQVGKIRKHVKTGGPSKAKARTRA
jgi:hypothetical protein